MGTKVLRQNNKYLVEHRKEGFDLSKFEVVGNLTITDNGIINDFDYNTTTNYVTAPFTHYTNGEDVLKVSLQYTYKGDDADKRICRIGSEWYAPAITFTGDGKFTAYFYDGSTSGDAIAPLKPTIGETYIVECIYCNTYRTVNIYNLSGDLLSTKTNNKVLNFNANCTHLRIYKPLDLKTVMIDVNNSPVFNGQKDKYYVLQI